MSLILKVKNIKITDSGIFMVVNDREFFADFEYFPELKEAPLRCIFDIYFSSWDMVDQDSEIAWNQNDTFHIDELNFGVHADCFYDQEWNKKFDNKNRPHSFTTQIHYPNT
jgi:hypothetical protein